MDHGEVLRAFFARISLEKKEGKYILGNYFWKGNISTALFPKHPDLVAGLCEMVKLVYIFRI
jgi:hypothetical protein